MAVTSVPQLLRETDRFRHVMTVLAKYGLAPWLRHVNISWIQRLFRDAEGQQLSEMTTEERVRSAIVELGTTFIKLGQILSTRADIIGPELAEELARLRASVPADPPEVARAMIEKELGRPIEELFDEFEPQAMASASIGQVHRARLKDGTAVVVKVQHPEIEKLIKIDLDIVKRLAELAERHSLTLRRFQPVKIAAEFSRTLLYELDFRREQRNMRQFLRRFSRDKTVKFAKPFPEFCTQRVLTMELLEGICIGDAGGLTAAGVELNQITERGAKIFLEMIFRDGFFHADPHPGNLLILPDQRIGILDCGMVGRIEQQLRDDIEDMLLSVISGNSRRLVRAVEQLGSLPQDMDEHQLHSDIEQFVSEYTNQKMKDFDLSGALREMIAIIRRHSILLPASITMLIKVLIMLEGTSRMLQPEFSLAELLTPYRLSTLRRRLSPQRILGQLENQYHD